MNKFTQDPTQDSLYPEEIVNRLDQFIIGQKAAKKAVAIAIRNRWRRLRTGDMQHEIYPKNILMIGPTGVGKTEIARRIANIINAPFIKIEATKFTEVGYVGRDVDSIIRDLLAVAIEQLREKSLIENQKQAEKNVEEAIIALLMKEEANNQNAETKETKKTKKQWQKDYQKGNLDETMIEIETKPNIGVEIMTPAGMEDISNQLNSWIQSIPTEKNKPVKMKIMDARKTLLQEEQHALINEEQIKSQAIEHVEENGIVFIDEIDKVVKSTHNTSEVSREGVQRDLLPLIEGTTVQTKHGSVNTDHILFITSGSFMGVQPSDMASELQGRLPIRVHLDPLTAEDFKDILSTPKGALTEQYIALLKTEGVTLKFTKDGIEKLASIAHQLNQKNDNIGARRLHTVMEKCLENISFSAHHHKGEAITVNQAYVEKELPVKFEEEDLEKWIL